MTVIAKILDQKPLIIAMGTVFSIFFGCIGYDFGTWDASHVSLLVGLTGGIVGGFFIGSSLGILGALLNAFIHPKYTSRAKTEIGQGA
jgi:hypothetical protein